MKNKRSLRKHTKMLLLSLIQSNHKRYSDFFLKKDAKTIENFPCDNKLTLPFP